MALKLYGDPKIASALERGDTLPARWYVDEKVFEAEKERIFHRTWQYVGHTGQVSNVGDFFTTRLGDMPVVIVRDTGGALRAFANVCRHRGSEVVLECAGNRRTLQCHYHGWTYNLDGTLRTAPRENEQRAFAKETLSLAAIRSRDVGAADFRQPFSSRHSIARPDRRTTGHLRARGNRSGANEDASAGPLRHGVELESRRREFQRMLPLPDRASEVFTGDRHRELSCRHRSRVLLDLLRPDPEIARPAASPTQRCGPT